MTDNDTRRPEAEFSETDRRTLCSLAEMFSDKEERDQQRRLVHEGATLREIILAYKTNRRLISGLKAIGGLIVLACPPSPPSRASISGRGNRRPRIKCKPRTRLSPACARAFAHGDDMRSLDEIVVHCSATPPGWRKDQTPDRKVAEIRRWHMEDNRWDDIGYHYLIDRDGTMMEGRPVEQEGAHVKGRNKTTIGICLLGGQGSSATDAFQDHFTAGQDRELRELIAKLKTTYPTIKRVSGHNQYAAKACPGFKVGLWYARKRPRTSPVQSRTLQAGTFSALARACGTVTAAVSEMDPVAQYILIAGGVMILCAALVIFRERLRHWAEGVR